MIEIVIENIQHEYLNDEFSQLRVTYQIYKENKIIKRGIRYIQEDLSFQEIKDLIQSKEEGQPIITRSNALLIINEIKTESEIKEEKEEL